MRKVAIYGRNGIGKSTTTRNLVAGLAEMGKKVMIVGCDPKANSTRFLLHGFVQKTVWDVLRDKTERIELNDLIKTGINGVRCVELGCPGSTSGCPEYRVSTAIRFLEQLGAFDDKKQWDYVFYDGLADAVCSRCLLPREGKAMEMYIVCSGETMTMYAANVTCKFISKLEERVKLCGLICHSSKAENETKMVQEFAEKLGSKVIHYIPNDDITQLAEENQRTVIDYAPVHPLADEYRILAKKIEENVKQIIPASLSVRELINLLTNYGMLN